MLKPRFKNRRYINNATFGKDPLVRCGDVLPSYDPKAQAVFSELGDVPEIAKPVIETAFIQLSDLDYWGQDGFFLLMSLPTLDWRKTTIEVKSGIIGATFPSLEAGNLDSARGVYPSMNKGFVHYGTGSYMLTPFIPSEKIIKNDSTEVYVSYKNEAAATDRHNYGSSDSTSKTIGLTLKNAAGKLSHNAYSNNTNGKTEVAAVLGLKGIKLCVARNDGGEIIHNGAVVATRMTLDGDPPDTPVTLNALNTNGVIGLARSQSPFIAWGSLGKAVPIDKREETSAIFEDLITGLGMVRELNDKLLVIDGNSYTNVWAYGISRKVEHRLFMQGWNIDNVGYNGKETTEMITGFTTDVSPLLAEKHKKKYFFALECINDYADNSATKEETLANYQAVCARAKSEGAIVIAIGTFLRDFTGDLGGRTETAFNLDQSAITTDIELNYVYYADYVISHRLDPDRFLYAEDFGTVEEYNSAVAARIIDTTIYGDYTPHFNLEHTKRIGDNLADALLELEAIPEPTERTLVDVDFSTLLNLDDFNIATTGSASIILDGGYLKISGTPSPVVPFNTHALYDYVTGREHIKIQVVFSPQTKTTNTEGLCIGFVNDSTIVDLRDDVYYWLRDSNSSADGQLLVERDGIAGGFDTKPVIQEIGGVYRLTLEIKKNKVVLTRERIEIEGDIITVLESAYKEYQYDTTDYSGQLGMSSSKLGVWQIGGTNWLSSLEITTIDPEFADYLVIGDEITDGYGAEYNFYNWFARVQRRNSEMNFVKSARYGDKPSTANNKFAEFQEVTATKAILFIGANQVDVDGVASALASYATLYAELQSQGFTEFIHISTIPNGNADRDIYNSSVASTYSSDTIIDIYTEFDDGTGDLKVEYDNGDGSLNQGAHIFIHSEIQTLL